MRASQNIGRRYVEGLMTPDLYLRRGLQYTFKIEGGNNAASAEFYHPFIITDEPVGGYNRLTKEQKSKVFCHRDENDGCDCDYLSADKNDILNAGQ